MLEIKAFHINIDTCSNALPTSMSNTAADPSVLRGIISVDLSGLQRSSDKLRTICRWRSNSVANVYHTTQ